MSNPFEVLGIPNNASETEIKDAYRTLAKKYHPDNYNNAPDIAEVAAEKMREVNEAYNTIMKDRKNGGSGAGSSANSGSRPNSSSNAGSSYRPNPGASYSSADSGNAGRYSTTTSFANVRGLIMAGRYDDADEVLGLVSAERRNAEWYFLKGTVLYSRGWLEQSYTYLQTAVNMDPGNNEYRAAFNQAGKMRSGSAGGYKVSGKDGVGCNLCSSCCSFMCADQCCECCGGDLITCC